MTEKNSEMTENTKETFMAEINEPDISAGSFDALYDMMIGYVIIVLSSLTLISDLSRIIQPYLFIRSGAQLMCWENLFHNFIVEPYLIVEFFLSAGFLVGGIAIHFSKKWGYVLTKSLFALFAVIIAVTILPQYFVIELFNFISKGNKGSLVLVYLLSAAALVIISVYLAVRGTKEDIFKAARISALFVTYLWALLFKYFISEELPGSGMDIIEYTPFIFHILIFILGFRTIKKYYKYHNSK